MATSRGTRVLALVVATLVLGVLFGDPLTYPPRADTNNKITFALDWDGHHDTVHLTYTAG